MDHHLFAEILEDGIDSVDDLGIDGGILFFDLHEALGVFRQDVERVAVPRRGVASWESDELLRT